MVEVIALHEGLHQALFRLFQCIQVERDPKILIDSIYYVIHTPWFIKFLVQEIHRMAQAAVHISLSSMFYVKPNFVANAMSATAHFNLISIVVVAQEILVCRVVLRCN